MIVIIPCHSRPEFLSVCLEYIQKADNADQNEYVFCMDGGYDKKYLEVIADFPLTNCTVELTDNNYESRISFNALNSLVMVSHNDLMCYLEEDIIIGKSFFTFAECIHNQEPDIFEVIMSRNLNSADAVSDDTESYYVKENTNDHQYYGNVFKGAMIKKYLADHLTDEYLNDTTGYCLKHFPKTALNPNFSELDGLTRRIIEKEHLQVAFPDIPRCFHAGFTGAHRKIITDYYLLTFDEKVTFVKEYIFDIEKLKTIIDNPNFINDSLPIDLSI